MTTPLLPGNVLSRFTRWSIAIGVVLRVVFAGINSEANDDHMPVIRTIAFEHRFPAVKEQWESFQPKLYHTTVAVVLRLFDVRTPAAQIHIAEMISGIAGLLTLLVAIRFFRRTTLSSRAQGAAIAFVSLNPALIGINAQATNDSFVILFGTAVLVYGVEFFRGRRSRDFVVMTAAALAAGLSKGNGLVTIIACLLVLGAAIALRNPRDSSGPPRMSRYVLTFAVVVLPIVWFFTPLHTNLRDSGTPFVTNWPKSPLPSLLHETINPNFRPGVRSMVDGLLTFRFADLLRYPYNTHGRPFFNANRTSLWTQVYAHTFFLRFDRFPTSWASIAPPVQALGRIQLVLALVPAILLLMGLGGVIDQLWTWVRGSVECHFDASATLISLTAFGYLAFLAAYTVVVRDFSVMKAIFLFPAIVAYTYIAAREYDVVIGARAIPNVVTQLVNASFCALLVGFILDVTSIVCQLTLGWPS